MPKTKRRSGQPGRRTREGLAISLEIIDQINAQMARFTPRQRTLAEYILRSPESLAFLTITDVANNAGVSQATIVRFCNCLGFDGYAHLAHEIQQAIQAELGNVGRFTLDREILGQTPQTAPGSIFERVLKREIDNLISLSQNVKSQDFHDCVELLAQADRACVIGCLASTSLAVYMGDMLSKIMPQIAVISRLDILTSASLGRLTSRSVAFALAFPRYPRHTLELARLAKEREAKVVALTNSHISPVVPLADLCFYIPVGAPSFVDNYAAPMAFINALITEYSERDPERTKRALSNYDHFTSMMNLFVKAEGREHKTNI